MPTSGDTPEWVKGDLPPELQSPPGDGVPQATPAPAATPATNGGQARPGEAPVGERPEQSAPAVPPENAAPDDATTDAGLDAAAVEQPGAEEQLAAHQPLAADDQPSADEPPATDERLMAGEQLAAEHEPPAEPLAPSLVPGVGDDDLSEPGPSDPDQPPPASIEPALSGQVEVVDHPAPQTEHREASHRDAIPKVPSVRNTSYAAPDPRQSIEALLATPLSLEAQIESLLFVADGAVPVGRLAEALEVSNREIETALAGLGEAYRQRGLSLQRFRDKVQLTTSPAAASRVERFLGLAAATPLSRAALETLAIVAYQQPVTRPQIEAVRGVNSDSVIKNLLGKGLIEELGRAEGPGRPVLYSTTPEFMQHFGLTSLSDLPPLSQPGAEGAQHAEQILKG